MCIKSSELDKIQRGYRYNGAEKYPKKSYTVDELQQLDHFARLFAERRIAQERAAGAELGTMDARSRGHRDGATPAPFFCPPDKGKKRARAQSVSTDSESIIFLSLRHYC